MDYMITSSRFLSAYEQIWWGLSIFREVKSMKLPPVLNKYFMFLDMKDEIEIWGNLILETEWSFLKAAE